MQTLDQLMPGEWGCAKEHSVERLKQLGLTAETKILCLQKSPFRDPVSYEFRGSVFAIRKKDAEKIPIIKDGEEWSWD